MEEKIKKIALLQYCLMEENQDFSEAGKDRVRIDFARHLLKLPPSYQISTLDLDRFDKLTKQDLDPHAETKKLLHELRGEENVIIANRKQGFPLVLYGPITTFKKAGCTIHILEKEIARTPTAVLAIAAFTKQEKEIVIRKEALEHVFWRKWAASEDFKFKKLVLSLYGIKSREDLETNKNCLSKKCLKLQLCMKFAILWFQATSKIRISISSARCWMLIYPKPQQMFSMNSWLSGNLSMVPSLI